VCVFIVLRPFDKKYNNPFIDDNDYIKLANNFMEYINYEPVLYIPTDNKINNYTNYTLQTNSKYYIYDSISILYPIILLNDIEIMAGHL
jgi:hypothetical protein